jgi:hypothetical protein
MIKVYVDTSVFWGYFDAEFEDWSNKLIEEFKLGLKVLVNLKYGYPLLEIRSPREVLYER